MTRPVLATVIARHAARLMALPGVVGVGEGAGPAIVVLLAWGAAGPPTDLPAELDGYPVRIRRCAPPRAEPASGAG